MEKKEVQEIGDQLEIASAMYGDEFVGDIFLEVAAMREEELRRETPGSQLLKDLDEARALGKVDF